MVTATVKTEWTDRQLKDAVNKAAYRNIGNAAASIRKAAIASIETRSTPSEPGRPPHTRRGQLRRAILYSSDNITAVIGPVRSRMGPAAQAHEFGGAFRGQTFTKRPFMAPALEKSLGRFIGTWVGAVKN